MLCCFHSLINTQTFRRALTAPMDSCAEIKIVLSVALPVLAELGGRCRKAMLKVLVILCLDLLHSHSIFPVSVSATLSPKRNPLWPEQHNSEHIKRFTCKWHQSAVGQTAKWRLLPRDATQSAVATLLMVYIYWQKDVCLPVLLLSKRPTFMTWRQGQVSELTVPRRASPRPFLTDCGSGNEDAPGSLLPFTVIACMHTFSPALSAQKITSL